MPAGRPKTPLGVTPDERDQLERFTRSTTLPAGLARRARIVLLSDEGLTNQVITRQLRLSMPTVA